jgi:hypothetical protein
LPRLIAVVLAYMFVVSAMELAPRVVTMPEWPPTTLHA